MTVHVGNGMNPGTHGQEQGIDQVGVYTLFLQTNHQVKTDIGPMIIHNTQDWV